MLLSVDARTPYMAYLHICRAIFHDLVANGIRLSFFSKLNTCYR
ncbi:RAxF-45 family protein [Sutcliffiella rhizosphaerae]|uniref:Uncharacterized protein n=1 Tax=Sutcliffiella rhizosphaerae TaxID=2880967 RepID=A0ABM8YRI1_9BACI|nr:RAxF-45 family protein [Sutcliffiella rhizosphaerae]CAG9622438.1 hypothetical protein BACCIP111883_03229 [Sutcliffiella rhizosphaerae]